MEKGETVQQDNQDAAKAGRNNRRAVIGCLAALGVMGAITAASPTLYTMFCKATGYGGTTQRADSNTSSAIDRVVTVRFDSNVAPGLPWTFKPDVAKMDVKVGETTLAFYRATNNSDKPVKGHAIFNVTPEAFGSYFNKIECFCFTEQTLQPNQTVEMPVTFFLDPKLVEDKSTAELSELTLSYSFYPSEPKATTAAAAPPQPKTGG